MRLIGALLIAPVAITCLLASKVLGLFGADYAHYSTLLVLLLLSTLPDALINVAVAILRVQRRLVAVAAVTVTGAAITLGGGMAADAASGNHRRRLGRVGLASDRGHHAGRHRDSTDPGSSARTARDRLACVADGPSLSSPSPRPGTMSPREPIGADAHDIARRRQAHAITS